MARVSQDSQLGMRKKPRRQREGGWGNTRKQHSLRWLCSFSAPRSTREKIKIIKNASGKTAFGALSININMAYF